MAMIALLITTAFVLSHVLAQNVTSSFHIPNELFQWGPELQTFVGVSTVSDNTTTYIINCGTDDTPFWPGDVGCENNNSYTFSVNNAAQTEFLIPK